MAVKEEHIIRQIVKPEIVIDDIVIQDLESGEENGGAITNTPGKSPADQQEKAPTKYYSMQGAASPLIQINDFLYHDDDVISMTIGTDGFLPTIMVELLVRTKVVYTSGFPKDGDILSVFIRSKDDNFKPIRNDYEITYVSTEGSRKEETPERVTISGILHIEGMTDMRCSYVEGTSAEALQNIAKDMKLGFATNELSTKDHQVWISPYLPVSKFIENITSAAWKDSKSFFTSFVDIFYHLNFVNVDPLFSLKPGKELGISIESYTSDFDVYSEQIKTSLNILFTNHNMARYSSQWINKYRQVNTANSINRSHGYVKYTHYYDGLLRKKVKLFNDPLTSPGVENQKYIMKGRNNKDDRFKMVTHNWMGTMYGANGENQHQQYIYAQTWNHQNMIHLDKYYLEIELDQINMTLRNYQVVPLLIVVEKDQMRRKVNEPDDLTNSTTPKTQGTDKANSSELSEEDLPYVVDKFYTGDYVVQSIDYVYSGGYFKQRVKLLRREWPTPPQISRNKS